MKRLIPLLLTLLLLSGCSVLSDPLSEAVTLLSDVHDPLPDPHAPATLRSKDTVTLYFRYLDEPLLASETRELAFSPDQPREMTIVNALLSGPDVQSPDLMPLFPSGVRVLSTLRQGRTLFVTLNTQIMNAYPDEPSDWETDPYWAVEAPLRRRLTMQSLIATITENCDVDTVQVLSEQPGVVTDSLRLRERYYLVVSDPQALAEPLRRDESLLLSPENTLRTVLTLWQSRDWTRLSRYVSAQESPDYSGLPHLLDFSISGGSVSSDGQTATFTLSAAVRTGSTDEEKKGRIIRLQRERGLWHISLNQLTGWLED